MSHVNYIVILFINMKNHTQTTKKPFDCSVVIYIAIMVLAYALSVKF